MIDEAISKVGAAIRNALGSVFNLDWIPEIVFWYWWLFLAFIAVGAVIWLFGWSKIVRVAASMSFLLGVVFVAGGHVMTRRINAKKEKEQQRERKEREERDRQAEQRPDRRWPW